MKIALDHIGYIGPDVNNMAATFTRLGFQVVGPAPLHVSGAVENDDQPLQHSAHVMFAETYIELTSMKSASPAHHLAPYMRHGPGIRLLLLNTNDAHQKKRELEQQGQTVSSVQHATRQLTYGAGGEPYPMAEFLWLGLGEDPLPGTLGGYVEHRTRALVFDHGVMKHPNTVAGISALYTGDLTPASAMIEADNGNVDLLPVTEATEGTGNGLLGVELFATDLATCAAVLDERGVQFDRNQGLIEIRRRHAGGGFMRIRGPA